MTALVNILSPETSTPYSVLFVVFTLESLELTHDPEGFFPESHFGDFAG
jgi:hypothetical protein